MTVGAGIFALGFPVLSYSNRILPASCMACVSAEQRKYKQREGRLRSGSVFCQLTGVTLRRSHIPQQYRLMLVITFIGH